MIMTFIMSGVQAKNSPTKNGEVVSHSLGDGYNIEFAGDDYRFDNVDKSVMGQIQQLNSGTELAKVLDGEYVEGNIDLDKYSLLTSVQDLRPYRVSDNTTYTAKNVTVTWEVPNLSTNMDVLVLHYSTARNKWEIYSPKKIEGTKVTNTFKDLSPVAVIYKNNDTTQHKTVKTDDNSPIFLYTGLILLGLCGVQALRIINKKENEK